MAFTSTTRAPSSFGTLRPATTHSGGTASRGSSDKIQTTKYHLTPERPAHPECSDEEKDHHRYNTRSSAQPPPPPPSPPRNQPPSPPRNSRPDSPRADRSGGYDPEGVGHNLRDSLGIFGLGPSAVWMEVRAEFRQFSRIYHPDKHKSTRTKMSDVMKPKPSFSFSTTLETFWKIITGEQDACKQQQRTTYQVAQPRVRTR
eukprot:scaffold5625_cov90-Skeletonema_dohrnii-CCMP3373.AAC.2